MTPLALLQAALGRVGFAALYVGAGEATAASRSREERAREELRHSPTRPGVAASLVCMLARRSSSGHGGLLGVCAYHALLLPRARQSIMGIEARSSRDQPRLAERTSTRLSVRSTGGSQEADAPPFGSDS